MRLDDDRPYDAADLKALMDSARGWAQSWDDLLRYLTGAAIDTADFDQEQLAAFIRDIERLNRQGVDFATDYRELWRAITGEESARMPPPADIEPAPTNPVELENDYLSGLEFPAAKPTILEHVKKRQAPLRVIEVLERLEDKQYPAMGDLLAEVAQLAWER